MANDRCPPLDVLMFDLQSQLFLPIICNFVQKTWWLWCSNTAVQAWECGWPWLASGLCNTGGSPPCHAQKWAGLGTATPCRLSLPSPLSLRTSGPGGGGQGANWLLWEEPSRSCSNAAHCYARPFQNAHPETLLGLEGAPGLKSPRQARS